MSDGFPIPAFRPRALTIRDPVHDYLSFTRLERRVIDTALFQRLRHITQNATAFFTYPANRTSRFEHSLGCCHLAGHFIEAILANSQAEDLRRFLADFEEAVCDLSGTPRHQVASSSMELLWQGVRLAALLHDLGHLPFSHLSEKPVEANREVVLSATEADELELGGRVYHEAMTLELVRHDPEIERVLQNEPELLRIALAVLEGHPRWPVFDTLHEVVSAEVDVDRGDYIRRDGQACGVEFGRYDLHRVVESMRLYFDDEAGRFIIRPRESSLSAIEGFLAERYRLHHSVYFHPHVVLTDAVLMATLDLMTRLSAQGDPLVTRHFELDRCHWSGYLKDGLPSDEIWLWGAMRRVYSELSESRESGEHRFLHALLDAILFRRQRVFPLWKRIADYRAFHAQVAEPLLKDGYIPVREGELVLNALANHALEHDFQNNLRLASRMVREEEDFRLLVETKTFTPVSLRYQVISENGGPVPVHSISAPLRSLIEARQDAIHLFAFVIDLRDELPDFDRRRHLEDRGREVFVNDLVKWLEEWGWANLPLFGRE